MTKTFKEVQKDLQLFKEYKLEELTFLRENLKLATSNAALKDKLDDVSDFVRCCQQILKANGVLTKEDWEANRSGCDVEQLVDSVLK